MGLAATYQLSTPSLEGCNFCGQSITNCQCTKFDKNAPRDGTTIKDLSLNDPLQSFLYYATPALADNSNRVFGSTNTEADNDQSDNEGLGAPVGLSNSGPPSDGPSF